MKRIIKSGNKIKTYRCQCGCVFESDEGSSCPECGASISPELSQYDKGLQDPNKFHC